MPSNTGNRVGDSTTNQLDGIYDRLYSERGFRYEYRPGTVHFGNGCTSELAGELENEGVSRVLVVTGQTVGTQPAVMDPVLDGLGDTVIDVLPETTPAKRLGTAWTVAEAFDEHDADGLVAVGGGSTLDIVTVARLLAGRDATHDEVAAELAEQGTVMGPESDCAVPPGFAVPTTLAGAAFSHGAGISAAPETDPVEEPVGGGVADPRVMPTALFYDLEIIATTPSTVLTSSAMNGINKAIETLYASNSTPITDATAIHGLRLARDSLPALKTEDPDSEALERAVLGVVLARYGTSRGDGHTLSILHAFGQGLASEWDVHQGRAHATVTPAVLQYIFDNVDGRREILADIFGPIATDEQAESPAELAVDGVAAMRDAMDLPGRISDLDDHPEYEELEDVAAIVAENGFLANAPADLDPTREELQMVLETAW